jgi:hypothetical protein
MKNSTSILKAVELIVQYERKSALLQRRLSIGYAKVARLVDQLEAAGVIDCGRLKAQKSLFIHLKKYLGINRMN